jgi:DNA-binding MarR family transcriptional regulator
MASTSPRIADAEYAALSNVRYRIRRFLMFSEAEARIAGIEPQQHQLLLAIRGLQGREPATVAAVAERLQVRHHSAVELVTRAARTGLVIRTDDPDDARRVVLRLTPHGAGVLARLSRLHREELVEAGADLVRDLRRLMRAQRR